MRLQLTVVHRAPGRVPTRPVEVEVEAPVGATARDLAVALTRLVPLTQAADPADVADLAGLADVADQQLPGEPPDEPQSPAIWTGGSPLDDDTPVGRGALVDGAAITLGPRLAAEPFVRSSPRTPLALAIVHGP